MPLLQLASSTLPSLSWDESLLRLTLAAVLGGLIGVERELREREAGLRTHLLVSLGSALFTIVGAYGFNAFLNTGASVVRADPTRIAAQIVTGIGFLGAGAIIREGLSVRGLTTAATLWVVAAIGMAAGAGYYVPAVATTVLTLVALWPLRLFAHRMIERFRPEENRLIIELSSGSALKPLLEHFDDVRHVEVEDERDRRVVTLEADGIDEAAVAALSELEYVIGVSWRR